MKTLKKLLILVPILLIVTGCQTNPISGETELQFFSDDQDVELGAQYAPEIEKQLGGKILDLDLQNYIDEVGQKVAVVSHRPDFNYSFVALDSNQINAFALPGGHIFITRAMLKKMETEAQLASVLAHETAHVTARHVTTQMSRQIGISVLLQAGAAAVDSGIANQVANFGAQIISLSFSRKQERQADLGGLSYMVAAGYDPKGMVETMQMLESLSDSRPVEFFSTHPSPENRVEYIKDDIYMNNYDKPGMKVGADEYRINVLARLK